MTPFPTDDGPDPVRPDDPPAPASDLEVATTSADALRASVRVIGALAPATAAVLTSVLRTHVTAGRRYLRVDLGAATVTDDKVVDALVRAHQDIAGLGGMLVFENAGPRIVDAIRSATLYVQSRD